VTQVEYLPSNYKALSSNPSTAKKRGKKEDIPDLYGGKD
jgi:hypothetical protein